MISAQTLRVCREGKPASTFPDHARGGIIVRARALWKNRQPLRFQCGACLLRIMLAERHPDALLPAPDDVAVLARLAAHDIQRDLVGNADRARNLDTGSDRGDVANGARDRGAVELDRSGLEYALPRLCTSLIHSIAFDLKV